VAHSLIKFNRLPLALPFRLVGGSGEPTTHPATVPYGPCEWPTPQVKGTPEALAKFSSQSCVAVPQCQRALAIPRDQLLRSISTVPRPSGPTPVSATIPNHRRPTAAAQASPPLCRQLVPTVVLSGPPHQGYGGGSREIFVSVLHHRDFTYSFQWHYCHDTTV
jgi:hypothetical protein